MISSRRLKILAEAGLDIPGKDGLVDISAVSVDTALDKSGRIERYIGEVENPYQFRVGDTAVRVSYGAKGQELKDSLVSLLAEGRDLS